MERTAQYKTEDGKVFSTRKEAVTHEFILNNTSVFERIVKKNYSGKESDMVISFLSEHYSSISQAIETARPKKNRRTKAKMAEDNKSSEPEVVVVKKKTKK